MMRTFHKRTFRPYILSRMIRGTFMENDEGGKFKMLYYILIFDEVDSGIGGATSEKVGLKLKQLSQKHQVICITHLAQIAKYAVNQFRISKDVMNDRTFTTIVPLDTPDQRVEEIARMIGGKDITQATLTHARELLEQSAEPASS